MSRDPFESEVPTGPPIELALELLEDPVVQELWQKFQKPMGRETWVKATRYICAHFSRMLSVLSLVLVHLETGMPWESDEEEALAGRPPTDEATFLYAKLEEIRPAFGKVVSAIRRVAEEPFEPPTAGDVH